MVGSRTRLTCHARPRNAKGLKDYHWAEKTNMRYEARIFKIFRSVMGREEQSIYPCPKGRWGTY